MTEISEAARSKAHQLIADTPEGILWSTTAEIALARYIQAVSDAAKALQDDLGWSTLAQGNVGTRLFEFILPDPVDPFVECIKLILGGFEGERHAQEYAASLRKALAERGLEIREVQP